VIISVERLEVQGNKMSVTWDGKEWTVEYPPYVELGLVPRDLLWIMFGMVASEEWAWQSVLTIELPERVDSKITDWWTGLMKINHQANPYGLNKEEHCDFTFDRRMVTVHPRYPVSDNYHTYPTVAMNGMGKDALCQIGMLKELGHNPLGVMVNHRWLFRDRGEEVWEPLTTRLVLLESEFGVSTQMVKTNANEVFDLHIMPWYIYALPLMYLHQTKTCYHAMELEFNKYLNGVPVKPNTSVPVLLSINRLLKSLGYDMEYRSGTVPLPSYGTQKLLVERYPELQKLQTSCMHGFPNCDTCPKCQCHMAYLKVMGKNPKKYGYNGKISRKDITVEGLLDIERESQHWALSKANGWEPDMISWVEKYWDDALPYGIPRSGAIMNDHFGMFMGRFESYGKFTYSTGSWDETARQICKG